MTSAIQFYGVSRHYGAVKAVDDVDLVINSGEFFVLLGPSGSGKTTCLRLMAGFERPTLGRIDLLGEPVDDSPPYRRPVNTVFQDYALFPHLSVLDNVAYGLMVKRVSKRERYDQANAALAQVRLPDIGRRKPSQLSGGQRQRVALARALVNKPRVLLLDEPLGALDLKLREQMQQELKALQNELGITFVFVTHDQSEALSLADRIAIFNEGRVVQVDTPNAIYHKPESVFAADFVGSSNVLDPAFVEQIVGVTHPASLRPECIDIAPLSADGRTAQAPPTLVNERVRIAGVVTSHSFQGPSQRVSLRIGNYDLSAVLSNDAMTPAVGAQVEVIWPIKRMHVMTGAQG